MRGERHDQARHDQRPGLRIGEPFNPYRLFTGIFIPEALVRYRGLSCGAKIAYGRLARFAGENGDCWPSIPRLADEMGLGVTQAREYVKELEEKRFIEVDRENRHYRNDGSGGSNQYLFLWHTAFTGDLGEFRKAPPPLRKTEGVALRKTEAPTPPENRSQRESGFSRESVKESQSTLDYQPTNRTNRDSHAGDPLHATDEAPENQTQKPKSPSPEGTRRYSDEERAWLSDAIGFYGQRLKMRNLMGEEPPPIIVQKCLEVAGGISVQEVFEILKHRCQHGCEPGTGKGPRGWGWFPTVIANAIRNWREQEAAAHDPTLRKHWSEYRVTQDPYIAAAVTAFSMQDDLEATA